MRILILLVLFPFICNAQISAISAVSSASKHVASESYFSSVSTNQSGKTISVTFTTNVSNQNQPPSIYYAYVSGTPAKDSTLTCNIEGFYSPGGYPEGTHTYKWYVNNSIQGVGTEISGATSSTFVPGDDEVAKFCRCAPTPVQVGGINTTGTEITSNYTAQIDDPAFNPLTDIANLFTGHVGSGATNLAGVGWVNQGNQGLSNSTPNGADPIPTYNAGGGDPYVDFEASNNEELVLDLPSPQFTMPVEIWIEFELESTNASWSYLVDWNGSHRIEERNGPIYLSGGNCSFTAVANTRYVMRFVISGSANTSKFTVNNGTPKTDVAASTAVFGTSNGRMGSNSAGTSNRADVRVYNFFVIQGELSAGNVTNMWGWFGL